MRFTENPLLFF